MRLDIKNFVYCYSGDDIGRYLSLFKTWYLNSYEIVPVAIDECCL